MSSERGPGLHQAQSRSSANSRSHLYPARNFPASCMETAALPPCLPQPLPGWGVGGSMDPLLVYASSPVSDPNRLPRLRCLIQKPFLWGQDIGTRADFCSAHGRCPAPAPKEEVKSLRATLGWGGPQAEFRSKVRPWSGIPGSLGPPQPSSLRGSPEAGV